MMLYVVHNSFFILDIYRYEESALLRLKKLKQDSPDHHSFRIERWSVPDDIGINLIDDRMVI